MLLGFGALLAGFIINTFLLPQFELELGLGGVVGIAAIGVYFFIGLLELITGQPISYWAQKWEDLARWQRILIGTSLAFLAIIIFSIVAGLIVSQMTGG
jgi:hypothetical protein